MNLTTSWDLSKIYKDETSLQNDINYIKTEYPKVKDFQNNLNTPETILKYLKFSENLTTIIHKASLYINLSSYLDLSDTKYQEISKNFEFILDELSTAFSFVTPELQKVPNESLIIWTSPNGILKDYKQYFENFIKAKEHILTEEQNHLISLVPNETYSEIFDYLFDTDMNWSKINYNGQEIEVDENVYRKAMFSNDREYRKLIHKEFYKPIIQHRNVIASTLQSSIISDTKYAKIYKYKSSLESALKGKELPIEFYNNLIKTTRENAHLLQRYVNLKKIFLDLDEVHHYDISTSIFANIEKEYTYQEAVEIVLKSLEPMGDEYIEMVKQALTNGRVDVYSKKNKAGGAFSTGVTFGVEPYVLLNWKGTLDDIFTLTHELGHNIHSYLTSTNQPVQYAGYSIFLAEVASIFNENLLFNYLLENSETVEEKHVLIEHQLRNYAFTFFRQIMFADFEAQVHKGIENGISFSPDSFCELYKKIFLQYFSDSIVLDEEETYTWSRISHFYRSFYVYQYATGFAYSQNLANAVKNKKPNAVENVLTFLKAGNSKNPKEVLKDCGIIVEDSKSIEDVFINMEKLLTELENII